MAILKMIDANGQITLGDQYAGQRIFMDEVAPGVWIVKLDTLIPEQERWLWETEVQTKIDRAIAWAKEHPPQDTDWDLLAQRIEQ
jgi:hypothetical protein